MLGGEGEVKGRQADVLQLRRDFHEWLQRDPAPENRLANVEDVDRELDAASEALGQPRALRSRTVASPCADEHLATAKAAIADLHKSLDGLAPGAAEVQELERQWASLKARIAELTAPPARPSSAPACPPTRPPSLISQPRS